MRISYYPDTDTLYIDLKEVPGADALECMDDFVVDVNADGRPVGIEIEHASETVDLSHLKTEGLPSMRISYELPGSLHTVLGEYVTPEVSPALSVPNFHLEVFGDGDGDGDSARIVSQVLHEQAAELLG